MRIPNELKDADMLLTKYGRWAMDRFKKQHCISAEHMYNIPNSPGYTGPEVLIPDFRAMDVQRTLNLVPLQYRRVLQAQYIPQRLPPHAIRRMLRLTSSTWDGSWLAGLRMFDNNWRLHISKSSA